MRTPQRGCSDDNAFQFMAAFVASVFGGQPLLISGVTGPITVFNKTIYDIFVKNGSGGEGFDYHQFIGWVYLWGAILHWITAFTNGESIAKAQIYNAKAAFLIGIAALRYITRFPCETFGFYVAWVYIQVSRTCQEAKDTVDAGPPVRCPSVDSTIWTSKRHFCFPRYHVSTHQRSRTLKV